MKTELTGADLVAYLRDNPTSDAMRAAADEIERIGRNRDMWRNQCERQAARLTALHHAVATALGHIKAVITDGVYDATQLEAAEVALSVLQPAEPHVERASRIVDSWPEWKRNFALTKHDVKPTQPAAPAQEPINDKGWKLGNLLTLTQDDYPALGSLFVQIWEGDSVVARVYGESHDEVLSRANALLARYGHPVEPEGWRLVPKDPTQEMFYTCEHIFDHGNSGESPFEFFDRKYKGILEAAPKFGEEE